MNPRIQELASHYDLNPHPEGGFYRETYRSTGKLACPWDTREERNYVTAIYFMLVEGNFSAFHRIKADEQWHFYEGDALEIWGISPEGQAYSRVISKSNYQAVIPPRKIAIFSWLFNSCWDVVCYFIIMLRCRLK